MRKTYTIPIKESCFLGRYVHTEAATPLDSHKHEESIEICYLLSGTQNYSIGEKNYHLKSGDYFITLPDQFHGTDGAPQERGELIWLILQMPEEGEILDLPKLESKQLKDQLLSIESHHFKGDKHSKKLWNELWQKTVIESENVLEKMQLRHALIACLINFIQCSKTVIKERTDSLVEKCCERIDSNPCGTFSLEEMADKAHLSLSRFKTRFKQSAGMPPREYINRVKIDYAKKKMKEGVSLTEISENLGFSSSQYFSKIFKKYTRVTPGAWRVLS